MIVSSVIMDGVLQLPMTKVEFRLDYRKMSSMVWGLYNSQRIRKK